MKANAPESVVDFGRPLTRLSGQKKLRLIGGIQVQGETLGINLYPLLRMGEWYGISTK